ncbi:MAG: uroporphyrinogen-III synthase [Terriglobales bacterium]
MRKPNENHPLTGTRILVGRARHQAGSLSSSLRALGASVIEVPFIEIRKPQSFAPMDQALKNLKAYDWLILTSANGVDAMWERLRKLRITGRHSKRHFKHLEIAAIGPATKKAIVKHGFKVQMMPEEYVAESVVKGLRDKVKGKHILLVRAKVARDVIPDSLRDAGATVDVVEAYETVVPEKSRARLSEVFKNKERRPHVVTFTSSSTVRNFAELLSRPKAGASKSSTSRSSASELGASMAKALKSVQFASIGPITSGTLRELQLPVAIEAQEFTMGGLIRAIVLARYAEPTV